MNIRNFLKLASIVGLGSLLCSRRAKAATQQAGEVSVVALAANVTSTVNATTLENITGMTYAVVSGRTYHFEAYIPFAPGSATAGFKFGVNGPTVTDFRASIEVNNDASGLFVTSATITAVGQIAAGALASTAAQHAKIVGTITPSANGTLALQHTSNVAEGGVGLTTHRGAMLKVLALN